MRTSRRLGAARWAVGSYGSGGDRGNLKRRRDSDSGLLCGGLCAVLPFLNSPMLAIRKKVLAQSPMMAVTVRTRKFIRNPLLQRKQFVSA
mgnify:CR=1 FL=1